MKKVFEDIIASNDMQAIKNMVWKWIMFQTMCIMLCAKWMKQ